MLQVFVLYPENIAWLFTAEIKRSIPLHNSAVLNDTLCPIYPSLIAGDIT